MWVYLAAILANITYQDVLHAHRLHLVQLALQDLRSLHWVNANAQLDY
jgi:hypothetical protein